MGIGQDLEVLALDEHRVLEGAVVDERDLHVAGVGRILRLVELQRVEPVQGEIRIRGIAT
jgi:hypothetical protein